MPFIYCESQVYNQAEKTVFTESALWADSVYYLPCLYICLCVCVYAQLQNFHFRRSNLTVPVTSLGPSPQPSTPCQQTFPCCTV